VKIWIPLAVLGLALITAGGCSSEREEARQDAGATVDQVEDRVENSTERMEKQYDESRKQGEGRVESAGEGYDAVLDAGETTGE
jgi:hypothetical protein